MMTLSHLFTSILLFLSSPIITADIDNSNYVPSDNILLNCGTAGVMSGPDNRTWTGDMGSKFLTPKENTLEAVATAQDPSVPQVPYMTARLSTIQFTYSVKVTPGRKFVRLYFYPSNYTDHVAKDALFNVTSGNYTLLSNFSPFLAAKDLYPAYILREYSINVPSSSSYLNLTFSPCSNVRNSYAFINVIEIVSMPGDMFRSGLFIYFPQPYTIDPTVALETVYRLNVGGNSISPVWDSGLFRQWSDDSLYIYADGIGVVYPKDSDVTLTYPRSVPQYIAPSLVYGTARSMGPDPQVNLNYNLTWTMPVDPGFYYLVRLHFCEIQDAITDVNQRVFDIFINNQTAVKAADVIAWSGGIGVPVYKDFVVAFPDGTARQDLSVALHPSTAFKPQYYDAILNGLEVFKLSRPGGNLAGLSNKT